MNGANQKAAPARSRLAAIVFYLIFILLFPVTLVGYIVWVGKLLLAGRKSGVSITAQGPLSARWTQHLLGVRPDEPSKRLMLALPGVPALGLQHILTIRLYQAIHKSA